MELPRNQLSVGFVEECKTTERIFSINYKTRKCQKPLKANNKKDKSASRHF